MTTYKDFDAFLAETEQQRVGFEYAGQKFDLPAEVPAYYVLKLQRLAKQDKENIGTTEELELMTEFFTAMLGAENYDRLLATGIGFNALSRLVDWIMQQYTASNESPNVSKVQRGKKNKLNL